MKGILFSQMEPPADLEGEFNDWYETEHIPARLALPGFSRAVRYIERDAVRNYLAVYEIDDLEVLKSPGYQALKTTPSERTALMLKSVRGFTRYTCTLRFDTKSRSECGKFLSAVAFVVPREQEARLDSWYENEHIAQLMREPDWLRVRRYKVFSADGGAWTDIALQDLRSLRVMDSPQCEAARGGPRCSELAGQSWFETPGRWLFEVISVHANS